MNKQNLITNPINSLSRAIDHNFTAFFNSHGCHLEAENGLLYFKRAFDLDKKAKKVTLKATSLGNFQLYLNGQRVGATENGKTVYNELTPGWTDFRCRVMEYTYDVTDLCVSGNTLVAEVSRGWWNGRISFGIYGERGCAFACELIILYEDGKEESIVTDKSWQTAVGGPTRMADIWDGQYDDFTLPHPALFPDSLDWIEAVPFDGFDGEIVPFIGEYVRVREGLSRDPVSATVHFGTKDNGTDFGEIKVVSFKEGDGCEGLTLKAGQSVILDYGQEIVGRPRLKYKAKRGTSLEVFFAELLNDSGESSRGNDGPKGSMYIKNYRAAKARYVCVASGEGIEERMPLHTFYGFRYLEIVAGGDVELISVVGEVIGSEVTEGGSFKCDNPEINRLYSNIVWGMRGNYLYIPTDCPQRNERLGWTGDTQIFCGAASYIGDIQAFMRKWLIDAEDSQVGYDGAYGDVCPRNMKGGASAAWGDAGLIVPDRLYLMYADREIIEKHYDSMEWYMRCILKNGLRGPNPTYGDWLNYDVTDNVYISVCYHYYDASLMEKFSKILGKTDREKYYRGLSRDILKYWEELYVDGDKLKIETQTAYLLPLAFDMAEGKRAEGFKRELRRLIETNDYTLTTGFVGTGVLCQTLERAGMSDLAYSLLLQGKDPSWLYSVRQGATTVWERWNSYTLERGFGDVNMNSFNHYAYGAVAEWLYSGVCGILPDENDPGFGHFILRPTPDMREFIPSGQKRICSAEATYTSRKGIIESSWEKKGDEYVYKFTIPDGTAATVSLISQKDAITVNSVLMTGDRLLAKREGERLSFTLTPGKYTVKV